MTNQDLINHAEALLAWAKAPYDNKPKLEWEHREKWLPITNPAFHPYYGIGEGESLQLRLAPSPIAPGHNPAGLTVDQIPEGRRLMTVDEVKRDGNRHSQSCIWCWSEKGNLWNVNYCGAVERFTYSVPLDWVDPLLPKPKIAEGFNPFGLTEEQVEVEKGWRLISNEEYEAQKKVQGEGWPYFESTQYWHANKWDDNLGKPCFANPRPAGTLRTQKPPGYYLPKPKRLVRKPCGPEHFPPGSFVSSSNGEGWSSVTAVRGGDYEGIDAYSNHYTFKRLAEMENWKRSLDNGKTWLPCYVEVEE